MVLLAAAAVGVGRFVQSVRDGLLDRELSTRLAWEISNARQRIGSWDPADVTQQRIEQIPISKALRSRLNQPRWRATVEAIDEPAQALRVTLGLRCQIQGQAAEPEVLTFWVDASEETALVGDAP